MSNCFTGPKAGCKANRREGRAFLPYAKEMLETAPAKANHVVKQLHEGAEGRLSIATIVTSSTILADCLREFGKRYPDILVDITYVSGCEPEWEEREDKYDFHFSPSGYPSRRR